MLRLLVAVLILASVNTSYGLMCWGPDMGGWQIMSCDADEGLNTCIKVNTAEGHKTGCGNSAACTGAEVLQGFANLGSSLFGGSSKVDLIHCCDSFLCNGSESQVASLMLITLTGFLLKVLL
ncbi:unnamed protein product [Meganyctiphanes norvegica]|uniref:UPAR/Ly6 domain-containing protein n=1 Tax=Meganyctiphanes norvegica TaxID=48144 RepID=A0AAV2S595_MEGNR